jgi:GAF domain-containing protein
MVDGCVAGPPPPDVVGDQTKERLLARKAELVQAALEVSQELATAPDLKVLFERVVSLVKERFGYYHVQIFRLESALGAAVLVCGYGQIGREMLAARHSLPMRRGVVGTAAASGEPVLAPDVLKEPGWIPNPHLPDTKGELAVPIKLRDRVLGIIDVQSDVAGALGADDQMLLETISGPIAIAIESTTLRQEMEDSLHTLSAAQQESSERGWMSFRATGELPTGYLYDRVAARPLDDLWEPEFARAAQSGGIIVDRSPDGRSGLGVSPLVAHGEFIGVLGVYGDPGHPLSEQELQLVQMVSEQVAAALDNARLAGTTKSALLEARTLYRIGELVGRQADEASICASVSLALVEDLGYATSAVYLLDSDRDLLVEAAQTGAPSTPERRALPLSDLRELAARAVQSRHTVMANGTRHMAAQGRGPQKPPGPGRVAAVPVLAESRALGAIQVSRPLEAPELGDRDVRILEAVAIQTANGIERARLLKQTQEALAAAAAATRRYLRDAWDSFLEGRSAERQTYIARPEGVRRDEQFWPPEMQTALDRQEIVARVVRSEHGRTARSVLAVPLKVRGEVIGVVDLCREDSEQEWTERERALIEALVEEVGETIEGERQFAHTRSTLAETERMYEASQRISAADERGEVLQVVLEIVASTPVDHVALFTFGSPVTRGLPSTQELSAVWDRQEADPLVPLGLQCSIEELPFPYSVSKERSTVVPDVGEDQRLDPALRQHLLAQGFRAFAAVPLAVGDEWLGYSLVLTRNPHSFTSGEMRVYESVNRQAAIALRSARLYEEAQKRAHREQLIREITSKMRGTPDLETILNTAVEELGKALGVSRAFVRLSTGLTPKSVAPAAEPRAGPGDATSTTESEP